MQGLGAKAAFAQSGNTNSEPSGEYYEEPAKKLPIRQFDVVIAGGGTAGVFAALSAARQGAKTMLIEAKGYCGGIAVEGGTAIHSFYNLYAAGMMITSDHRAHMSTRNTVSCMGQGQATGTAAALCAARRWDSRELPYNRLRDTLVKGGVYFEG